MDEGKVPELKKKRLKRVPDDAELTLGAIVPSAIGEPFVANNEIDTPREYYEKERELFRVLDGIIPGSVDAILEERLDDIHVIQDTKSAFYKTLLEIADSFNKIILAKAHGSKFGSGSRLIAAIKKESRAVNHTLEYFGIDGVLNSHGADGDFSRELEDHFIRAEIKKDYEKLQEWAKKQGVWGNIGSWVRKRLADTAAQELRKAQHVPLQEVEFKFGRDSDEHERVNTLKMSISTQDIKRIQEHIRKKYGDDIDLG